MRMFTEIHQLQPRSASKNLKGSDAVQTLSLYKTSNCPCNERKNKCDIEEIEMSFLVGIYISV